MPAYCDNEGPLLSVIVPVYNTAEYLPACISGILEQSYRNIEVLLIDDGSSDGSERLCDDFAAADSRVRVVHNSNAGLGASRNRGLDLCRGQYITFVDSDDRISADAYEPNVGILESQPSADIVQFRYCREYDDGRTENGVEQGEGTIRSLTDKYREAFVHRRLRSYMPNKIFRRRVFDGLRFDERMLFEDRALLPQILERSADIIYSPHGLYYYRSRAGQITASYATPRFMESQIRADLAIVKHAVRHPELGDIVLKRYAECWYWCRRSGGLCYDELAACCPPAGTVLRAHCAAGLKIKCLLARFCPKMLL